MYCKKSKYKILLVDDDYLNYLYYSEIIPTDSYEIQYVNNGKDAIKICKQDDKIDLVLMDIKMPGFDGITAIEKIRVFNSEIPIIIQSAYISERELKKLTSLGFVDYVYKPVREKDLLKKINQMIGVGCK